MTCRDLPLKGRARLNLLRFLVLSGVLLPSVAGADNSFTSKFLQRYCMQCHDVGSAEGNIVLTGAALRPGEASYSLLQGVYFAVKSGEMPPDGEDQPRDHHRKQFLVELMSLGRAALMEEKRKSAQPGLGNYVDHKKLFTEPDQRRAATPARLWRMSPHIFMKQANRLSGAPLIKASSNQGGDGLHPAFSYMTPTHAFRDHADQNVLEQATTELLFDIAWQVAGLQVSGPRVGRGIQRFLDAEGPDEAAWGARIEKQFHSVLSRDPTPQEKRELLNLAKEVLRQSKREDALQTVFAAVILKPESVYRYELGAGKPDRHGRVVLGPNELAYAISYALTDLPPSEALLESVRGGQLRSREDVARQVRLLLDDEDATRDRMTRFFQEYFEYTRAPEIFKDARTGKHIFATTRVSDADALVQWILEDDRDVLKRMLTEDHVFVVKNGLPVKNAPMTGRIRRSVFKDYGLPRDWEWTEDQPVKPESGRRSGLLTHPAWLLAFSDNEKNQAIQRGRWIQTKLLGGVIPDTPIGVDAKLPTSEKLTLREKMHRVTRANYCWTCHEKMDPLGLPLEQFDDFGGFRTTELGRPVVTSGEISIGDPAIDGEVKDPFEMLQRLATSQHVEQVFIRHVFRFFLGRNETLDDAPTLIDAHQAYRESGGSMKALVNSLLVSDSFLLRRLPGR